MTLEFRRRFQRAHGAVTAVDAVAETPSLGEAEVGDPAAHGLVDPGEPGVELPQDHGVPHRPEDDGGVPRERGGLELDAVRCGLER